MLRILAILMIATACSAQTNLPPWSPPPPPIAIQDVPDIYPFLIATGVDTNTGKVILEAPADWQLAPPPEPTQTTIRLKFHDKLNTNALYAVEFTCPRNTAFAGWEIVEQ